MAHWFFSSSLSPKHLAEVVELNNLFLSYFFSRSILSSSSNFSTKFSSLPMSSIDDDLAFYLIFEQISSNWALNFNFKT